MQSPVTPADFKSCVADPSGSLCSKFQNVILKLPVLLYKLINFMFDSSGNLSDGFTKSVIPSGTLLLSASASVPTGYLTCNGSPVLRTAYPDLFTAIGTVYGPGDGTSTFNLPDFRDRFPVGAGTTYVAGDKGGLANVALQTTHIPVHSHFVANTETGSTNSANVDATKVVQMNGRNNSSSLEYKLLGSATPASVGKTSDVGGGTETAGVFAGNEHENRPPYLAVNVYIKT